MCVGFWLLLCALVELGYVSRVQKERHENITFFTSKTTVHVRPELPPRLYLSVVQLSDNFRERGLGCLRQVAGNHRSTLGSNIIRQRLSGKESLC